MKRHGAQLQREIEVVSNALVCVTVTGVVVLSVLYMTPAPAAVSPGSASPWMATAIGVLVSFAVTAVALALRLKSIARRVGAAEVQGGGVPRSDTDAPHPGTDAARDSLKKYLVGLGGVALLQFVGLMQLMNALGRPGQDFVMWRMYTAALLGLVVLMFVFVVRLERAIQPRQPSSPGALRARMRQVGGAVSLIGVAHIGLLALPVFGVDRDLDFGVLNRQTGVLLGLLAVNGLIVCVGWRLRWLADEAVE